MNTDSTMPKDLNTLLNGSLLAAKFLCSSKNLFIPKKNGTPSDSALLCNTIDQLHNARKTYPSHDRLISQVIFRIHDRACKTNKKLGLAAHMATIHGFAQTPTKDVTVLKDTLKRISIVASSLCTSTNEVDSTALQDMLYTLHTYRTAYPQFNRMISQRIFKIHDQAFYGRSDLARQKAHIATICGFEQIPTQNMAILEELLNRIAMVQKPKNMAAAFQSLLTKIVNAYVTQDYQHKDTNLKTAHRLKYFMNMMYPLAKTKSQQQNVHDCASRLESVVPNFKGLSKNFPVTVVKKTPRFDFKEAVDVFSPRPYIRGRARDWEE